MFLWCIMWFESLTPGFFSLGWSIFKKCFSISGQLSDAGAQCTVMVLVHEGHYEIPLKFIVHHEKEF